MISSTKRTWCTFAFFAWLLWCEGSIAQQLSSDDYARAEKMMSYNTSPLIDRYAVYPQWLPDGTFWYSVFIPNGREYVLINPKNKTRKSNTDLSKLVSNSSHKDEEGENSVRSPDGKKEVFIRDWNLWLRDVATKKETPLTTDGIKDFGYATDNAGWRKSDSPIVLWSPDSRKIATYQQDQRHVHDMYLVSTNVGSPRAEIYKYPMPMDKEIIQIHRVIIDVENVKTVRLQIPADARRGTVCDDISCSGKFDDNEWSPDGSKLAFVSSSRDHKRAKLRVADATTGAVSEIMEEVVATQYESGQGMSNWRYLSSSNEFIWYSERDDWGHL